MSRIFFVRHGETDFNRGARRWIGWSDPPLNEEGRSQAKAIARRLQGESLAAIYSSDLVRALDTARCVAARYGVAVTPLRELREVNYGDWEGQTVEECRQKDPDLFRRRAEDPETVRPPGGESYYDLMRRFLPAIEQILRKHRHEAIAVVSHYGNIRVLLCHLLGLPLKQYRAFPHANGAVTVLSGKNDRLVVETINDTCHLPACSFVSDWQM